MLKSFGGGLPQTQIGGKSVTNEKNKIKANQVISQLILRTNLYQTVDKKRQNRALINLAQHLYSKVVILDFKKITFGKD